MLSVEYSLKCIWWMFVCYEFICYEFVCYEFCMLWIYDVYIQYDVLVSKWYLVISNVQYLVLVSKWFLIISNVQYLIISNDF